MLNSRGSQPISLIKERVQRRVKGNYCVSHQQKTLTYYQLHYDKVIFIQRWFRKQLVSHNRKDETLILAKVKNREELLQINREMVQEFSEKQEERTALMAMTQGEFLKEAEERITNKVTKVIQGTLANADKLAQNNGRAKYALAEIKVNRNRSEQLEGEIQALKFQLECHSQRKAEWKEKLWQLRQAVAEETSRSKDLEVKLSQMCSGKRAKGDKAALQSL